MFQAGWDWAECQGKLESWSVHPLGSFSETPSAAASFCRSTVLGSCLTGTVLREETALLNLPSCNVPASDWISVGIFYRPFVMEVFSKVRTLVLVERNWTLPEIS